jgi:16S rRNA (guanine527-N7)-methyltransferase
VSWFNKERFHTSLAQIGITDVNTDQFYRYGELLIEWNKKFNLTRVAPEDFETRHFIDSLLLVPYLEGERIVDIGSGAGLPGIPLSIVRPEMQFVLVDSRLKRVNFLKEVIRSLDLKNATALHSRIEDLKDKYDVVVSRAVSSMENLVKLSKPLLKKGGYGLAIKGPEVVNEGIEVIKPKYPENFPISTLIVKYQ